MGHELAVGGKAADCQPMWVRVWGRQLTRILTHTIFSVFAAKKHRKPKFSMLFGAGGVTRTHDLLITKCIRALHSTVFRDFGAFLSGVLRTSALSVPLLPSAHFPVWVRVWVKPLSEYERGAYL